MLGVCLFQIHHKKCSRFDDKRQRQANRLASQDKFRLMRIIWDRFVENCGAHYKPGKHLTVDEQLFPCKSRCAFIQYMPNKPDKFGIKFWILCDAELKYILNIAPYVGKDEAKKTSDLQGEHTVKQLIKSYEHKGHCVTCDNFFTSQALAHDLLDVKTTLIGTIRKSKKELPPIVRENKELHSTLFLQDRERGTMLTIYQCKPNKNVAVLTTEIDQALIPERIEVPKKYDFAGFRENMKAKPLSILAYNAHKAGVDSVDQMTRIYNVKSPCRRWPLQVFFNMLNLTSINSWVLYKEVHGKKLSRRNFIVGLIQEIRSLKNPTTIASPLSQTSPSIKRHTTLTSILAPLTPPASKKIICLENENGITQSTISKDDLRFGKVNVKFKRNRSINVCTKCELEICGSCSAKVLEIATCIICFS
jgi:hypothetical protein